MECWDVWHCRCGWYLHLIIIIIISLCLSFSLSLSLSPFLFIFIFYYPSARLPRPSPFHISNRLVRLHMRMGGGRLTFVCVLSIWLSLILIIYLFASDWWVIGSMQTTLAFFICGCVHRRFFCGHDSVGMSSALHADWPQLLLPIPLINLSIAWLWFDAYQILDTIIELMACFGGGRRRPTLFLSLTNRQLPQWHQLIAHRPLGLISSPSSNCLQPSVDSSHARNQHSIK